MAIAKLIQRNVRPVHKHDCTKCEFLGRLDGKDLYFCRAEDAFTSRYGSEPSANASRAARFARSPGEDFTLARALLARNQTPNSYITL